MVKLYYEKINNIIDCRNICNAFGCQDKTNAD